MLQQQYHRIEVLMPTKTMCWNKIFVPLLDQICRQNEKFELFKSLEQRINPPGSGISFYLFTLPFWTQKSQTHTQ